LHSCKVYDESLLDGQATSPVPPDQWGSGIGWWSTKGKNGCISAGLPTEADRPKSASADVLPPMHFAIRTMALGSMDRKGEKTDGAWKSLGLDLDGICTNSETCDIEPSTLPCTPSAALPPDGRECRDNTFGRLESEAIALQGLGKDFGLSNDAFNCALCRGDYNFTFRISNWNGTPTDDSVRLDFYPSPGLEQLPAWQCDLNAPTGAWKKNPCWKATDKWTIRSGSYDGKLDPKQLPNALLNDPNAYVRDGYVVGQLPENTEFWFPGKSAAWAYPVTLQRAMVVAKLVETEGGHRIEDGTIVGRARTTDLIKAFESLGLCEGHPLYTLMKGQVGLNADVLWNGTNSESAACDALSVGIGFDADPASFGGEKPAVTLPGCPASTDGGTDGGGQDAGAD
jgi:hypothetical protein